MRLVHALNLAHRSLEVESLDVLPVLLEQGNQEVNSDVDVGEELLLGHLDVADSNTKAKSLLELELDGGLNLINLLIHLLGVLDKTRELTGLVKTGSQKTGDLLDESIRGKERVVLLGELLDKLLVLVELLEVLNVHAGDAVLLSLLAVLGVSENAHSHVGTGDLGEPDRAAETLVLLGIVVLETDLELDSLAELTLLLSGFLEHGSDGLADRLALELTLQTTKEWATQGSVGCLVNHIRTNMQCTTK